MHQSQRSDNLSERWLSSSLQVLDVSNVAQLSAGSKEPEVAAEIFAALCAAVSAAGSNLKELNLDAATVSDELLAAIGRCCGRLESLSIIGCRPFTDAGLEAVARGCPLLKSLSVGGPSFGWRESIGLTAFKGLQELTISRRSSLCTDSSLIKVLQTPKLFSHRHLFLYPHSSMRTMGWVVCIAAACMGSSNMCINRGIELSPLRTKVEDVQVQAQICMQQARGPKMLSQGTGWH